MRALRRRHVGPVRRRQDVAAGHVQDVGGWELEVDRGAVGVVDDGWQEGVFSWMETESENGSELRGYKLKDKNTTTSIQF